jgi:hypothetical protein
MRRLQALAFVVTLLASAVASALARDVWVGGYVKGDGTYVRGHYRSAPDGDFWNNYSSLGNQNPYTGERGTRLPPLNYGADVSVQGYFRSDGTYVRPHMRTAPNDSLADNWSTYGNVNPYTGEVGTRRFDSPYALSSDLAARSAFQPPDPRWAARQPPGRPTNYLWCAPPTPPVGFEAPRLDADVVQWERGTDAARWPSRRRPSFLRVWPEARLEAGVLYPRHAQSYQSTATWGLGSGLLTYSSIMGIPGLVAPHPEQSVWAAPAASGPRGGVIIDPRPVANGPSDGELREQVVEQRPSADALTWSVDLPEEE